MLVEGVVLSVLADIEYSKKEVMGPQNNENQNAPWYQCCYIYEVYMSTMGYILKRLDIYPDQHCTTVWLKNLYIISRFERVV